MPVCYKRRRIKVPHYQSNEKTYTSITIISRLGEGSIFKISIKHNNSPLINNCFFQSKYRSDPINLYNYFIQEYATGKGSYDKKT